MLNEEFPPDEDTRQFERRLKLLQPRTPIGSELDLIYRCGWEAALASQPKPQASKSTLVQWSSFGGGLSAGVAASLLLWIWLAAPNRAPETVVSSQVVANSNISSGTEPKHALNKKTALSEANVAASADRSKNFRRVESLMPWDWFQNDSSLLNSHALSSSKDSVMIALSPVASRQWQLVLDSMHARDEEADENLLQNIPIQPNPTLREMLHDTNTWFDFPLRRASIK